MYVCKQCGSLDIQVQALVWVDANDNEIKEYIEDDQDERWCQKCKEKVDFCDFSEFEDD